MASELSREQFVESVRKLLSGEPGFMTASDAVLAHDAALRERVARLEAFLARIASLTIDETGTACFRNATDGHNIDAWRVAELTRQTLQRLHERVEELTNLQGHPQCWKVEHMELELQLAAITAQCEAAEQELEAERMQDGCRRHQELVASLQQQLAEREQRIKTLEAR